MKFFGFVKECQAMASRPHPASSKISRLRAQTKAIHGLNGLVLCLFGLSVGALAVASALPQKRQLDEKRLELARIEERERAVIAVKEDAQASYEALRDDPEYLELHARDRLNLHDPREKIYRIERER
ncbi:septum formation initiator family protein [Haloferula sp. A504]|uniref:septum formation initiator family protein n=1 Tax=Haloferula sp. A504 TaxID=3373601 RepID=UPI0031C9A253|nr:septum formation initiator family protein [Verrucomicrobiaceae bacterium E54]